MSDQVIVKERNSDGDSGLIIGLIAVILIGLFIWAVVSGRIDLGTNNNQSSDEGSVNVEIKTPSLPVDGDDDRSSSDISVGEQ